MLVEKKTLTKIKEFGLNSYESKVWVALLSRGVSTAGELSDIANVPRSRSYDVLESLEKKGFVVMKLGKPIKYIAVSPDEAIERVKKRIKRQAEEDEQLFDDLKKSEILSELTLLHNQGIEAQDPSDITGCVKGRDNIYDHLAFQIKNAKESIIIATSLEGLQRKSVALTKHIKKAKARGVQIQIAAPLSNQNKKDQDKLGAFAKINEAGNMNQRFCIVDDTAITLMLTDDSSVHPSYDMAVWMHSPYLAKTLLSLLS